MKKYSSENKLYQDHGGSGKDIIKPKHQISVIN